jgi:protein-tyrosine phosphatase
MTNSINFRDCGGHPATNGKRVKTGMLFRSASLDRVFGKNRRRVLDAELKTIIDFRTASERAKLTVPFPGVRQLFIPLMTDALIRERILAFVNKRNGSRDLITAVKSVYSDIVTFVAAPVKKIFTILAESDSYPLCMHCRAGKDRTGYAVALILRTCGVPDNCIIDDYLATNRNLLPRVRMVTRPLLYCSFGLLPARTWETSLTAYDRYLKAAFSVIDNTYNGTEGYLDYCGVSRSVRNRVREILCE